MHCFGEPCTVGSLALPVPRAPWAARQALIAAPGACRSQQPSFPGILGRRLGLVEVCALTKAGMQVEQGGRRGALTVPVAPEYQQCAASQQTLCSTTELLLHPQGTPGCSQVHVPGVALAARKAALMPCFCCYTGNLITPLPTGLKRLLAELCSPCRLR